MIKWDNYCHLEFNGTIVSYYYLHCIKLFYFYFIFIKNVLSIDFPRFNHLFNLFILIQLQYLN